jgi:DUF438 domain-containing protein
VLFSFQRDLLKDSISKVDELSNQAQIDEYISKQINLLIEEVEGMIFKEENILFPTSLEKLDINDWVEILKESNIISLLHCNKLPILVFY